MARGKEMRRNEEDNWGTKRCMDRRVPARIRRDVLMEEWFATSIKNLVCFWPTDIEEKLFALGILSVSRSPTWSPDFSGLFLLKPFSRPV